MKKLFSLSATAVIFLIAGLAHGMTADEIVEKSNRAAYYMEKDGSARVAMRITDSRGRERNRNFTILRRDQPGPNPEDDTYCRNQKYYVYFHLPADVNKMVFMVWKHVDREDDRWLYLPALDLVKRIAATEKRTSFVGSDFFYEDVSGRNITDDSHVLEKADPTYYVLMNTPKDKGLVEFSRYRTWIHKTTFLTVKVEYFDKQGEKYREYEALKVDTVQGIPTVTRSRMKDLTAGSETTLTYSQVKYAIGLPETIFTERYLRRPPSQFIR